MLVTPMDMEQTRGSLARRPITEALSGSALSPVLLEKGPEDFRKFFQPHPVTEQFRQSCAER